MVGLTPVRHEDFQAGALQEVAAGEHRPDLAEHPLPVQTLRVGQHLVGSGVTGLGSGVTGPISIEGYSVVIDTLHCFYTLWLLYLLYIYYLYTFYYASSFIYIQYNLVNILHFILSLILNLYIYRLYSTLNLKYINIYLFYSIFNLKYLHIYILINCNSASLNSGFPRV